jgi:hypothetical protein
MGLGIASGVVHQRASPVVVQALKHATIARHRRATLTGARTETSLATGPGSAGTRSEMSKSKLMLPRKTRTHSFLRVVSRCLPGHPSTLSNARSSSSLPDIVALPSAHSTNSLSSVTLDIKDTLNCTSAMTSLLSTFCQTLNKVFAECQLLLCKEKSLSRCQVTMTESLLSVLPYTR